MKRSDTEAITVLLGTSIVAAAIGLSTVQGNSYMQFASPEFSLRFPQEPLEVYQEFESPIPKEFEQYASQNPVEENSKILASLSDRAITSRFIKDMLTTPGIDNIHTTAIQNRNIIHTVEDQYVLDAIHAYQVFFSDSKNCRMIGKQIQQDLETAYTELGGVVIPTNEGLIFKQVPSLDAFRKDKRYDVFYHPHKWFNDIRALGTYHLRASEEDSSDHAGASSQDARSTKLGQINCVITSISPAVFNVDIFFKDKNEKMTINYDIGQFSRY